MLAKKSKKIHSQEKVSTVAGLKSAIPDRISSALPLGYTAGVDKVVLFRALRMCYVADSNYGVIIRSMVDKYLKQMIFAWPKTI